MLSGGLPILRRVTRMNRPLLHALALVLISLFVSASTAAAAVRIGVADDPIDTQDQTPSLDPKPVTADITHVQLGYDDAGTVDVQVTFVGDSAQPPGVDFELTCTDQPKLSGTIT